MANNNFYALIHCSADGLSYYDCVVNNEVGLIQVLKEESENCLSIDDLTLSEFEAEYDCSFSDYKKLRRCSKHLPKDFKRYYFQLSDMCVHLVLFTPDLDEVKKYLDDNKFEYDEVLNEDNVKKILDSYCERNDYR